MKGTENGKNERSKILKRKERWGRKKSEISNSTKEEFIELGKSNKEKNKIKSKRKKKKRKEKPQIKQKKWMQCVFGWMVSFQDL